MDLSGVEIKPAPGKVALRFVDDLDDDDDDGAQIGGNPPGVSLDDEYEGVLAIVVGVGADVKGIKKGATVIVSAWARDGLRIGDNTVICDSYCWQATISE